MTYNRPCYIYGRRSALRYDNLLHILFIHNEYSINLDVEVTHSFSIIGVTITDLNSDNNANLRNPCENSFTIIMSKKYVIREKKNLWFSICELKMKVQKSLLTKVRKKRHSSSSKENYIYSFKPR